MRERERAEGISDRRASAIVTTTSPDFTNLPALLQGAHNAETVCNTNIASSQQ